MSPSRTESVQPLATVVCDLRLDHPTRVTGDGTTASGKSTLAPELTCEVTAMGRQAIHLSMDGYHHPSHHRRRKGSLSAVGYYEDAYDVPAFAAHLHLSDRNPAETASVIVDTMTRMLRT
jgi:uridine kinase